MPDSSYLRTAVRELAILAVLALTVAACTRDVLIDPVFGAGCRVGTLTPGREVQRALDEDSCIDSFSLLRRAQTPYESWGAELSKGEGYHIVMSHRPDPRRLGRDDLDPILELWGRNADGGSRPLAISIDDADELNAELFFIAPAGGAFQVIAGGTDPYYEAESLGGYALEIQRCPVLGALGPDSLSSYALRESPCERRAARNVPEFAGAPLTYNFISFVADSGTNVTLSVDADEFTPVWEAFGPDWDSHNHLAEDGRVWGQIGEAPASRYFTKRTRITLAVGSTQPSGASRAFRVHKRISNTEPK